MSDSIRQKIADNILTRLQAISSGTGYSDDYVTIESWRLYPLEKTELPAIILQDTVNEVLQFNDEFTDYKLTVNIGIFVKGTESAKDLRNMIQDVMKCIGEDPGCGGYAFNIVPVSDTINMQQKEDVFGDIEIKFEVNYTCHSWDMTKQY